MKLIVGLGNPGKEYEKTRHNVGFMVLDKIADGLDLEFHESKKWHAEVAETTHESERIVLMKPQTYMNLSGEAVAACAKYYKLENHHIWVVSDDLDLDLGTVRVRDTGSSGGHNGLKSVMAHLTSEDFYRVRVGIGRPDRGDGSQIDSANYVLQPFDESEHFILNKALNDAATTILVALADGELQSHTVHHEVETKLPKYL